MEDQEETNSRHKKDEWNALFAVARAVTSNNCMMIEQMDDYGKRNCTSDHRSHPRKERRFFRHEEALHCIRRDYLGFPGDPRCPLLGKEFPLMFRVSRGRFQVMMEDIKAKNIPYYDN